jgi:hypothetical protein
MAGKTVRTYVLRTSHGYEDVYESLSTALHLLTDTLAKGGTGTWAAITIQDIEV